MRGWLNRILLFSNLAPALKIFAHISIIVFELKFEIEQKWQRGNLLAMTISSDIIR